MTLPFELIQETDIEKWRADTFFTKEPETIAWIESFKNDDVFWDVGANIGVYSLYCAAIHPESWIYSFEPDYVNFLRLMQNRNLNNYDRMFCFRWAIGAEFQTLPFFSPQIVAGSTGGQIGQPITEHGSTFTPEMVMQTAVMTVDDIVRKSLIKVPSHIKIDVDGQEDMVVAGMFVTLLNMDLKSILIEIDYARNDMEDITSLFKARGFTTDNEFNLMSNHSRHRRKAEGIRVENVVFSR